LHRLANGLTLIVESMPVEAITLNLWVKVGSAMEPDSINGVAHFLEHMIFKGSQCLGSGEFEQRVEARGATMNAATSQDYTHYYLTSAPQDFLDLAPLQLDVVLRPLLLPAEFEQERKVVLEEIRRSQDNLRHRIHQRTMQNTFERLPYRRSVLGPMEVIEQLTPEQMQSFHGIWYQPQNLTIAVAGNLSPPALIEHLSERVTAYDLPAAKPSNHNLAPEPPFTTIQRQEYCDERLQEARLILTWRVPGLDHLEEAYALDVLAAILSHGRTSRLVWDLRETRQQVSSILASNSTYSVQGAFSIAAKLPVKHLETVEAAILEHITQLHQEPITAAEIQRIRRQVANRFIFGNEQPSDRARLYGYYQTLLGDLQPALNYPQIIQALTPETLQQTAQRYLSATAYGVVILKPSNLSPERVSNQYSHKV
jgi:predicted Zn-dependent peptidase